jgi:hypothetical protein
MCAFGKDKIDELAKDPRFIPGIYNYCDRWCERCPYTGRCMNYELCEDHYDSTESKDIQNKEFWDKLGEVFAVTMQMVKEHAEEMGIDLDDIDHEEIEHQQQQIDAKAESHPCSKMAMQYADCVKDWLESSKHLFEEKQEQLQSCLEMALPRSNPIGQAGDISDAIEVIQWYQHFIYVKLMRALHGLFRKDEDDIEMYDANGSAKVALIGIDRSIGAWGRLLEHFTEQEGTLLPILVQLQHLRKTAENAFPNARNFIRPGLE